MAVQEPHVSLVTTNSHLIGSEVHLREYSPTNPFRQFDILLHTCHGCRGKAVLQVRIAVQPGDADITLDPLSERPWELIYPQDADHIPQYNPCGKYCVKLFWLVGLAKLFGCNS